MFIHGDRAAAAADDCTVLHCTVYCTVLTVLYMSLSGFQYADVSPTIKRSDRTTTMHARYF